jgi:hypothetical protein
MYAKWMSLPMVLLLSFAGVAQENCNDGIDNDGDSFVDCDDWDCHATPPCGVAEICGDGIDNDGDSYVDCDDFDCDGSPGCNSTTEGEGVAEGEGQPEGEGEGTPSCHAADQDCSGTINLTELLRVIQFFNIRGYHACPGMGTEDGYCPGL